LGGDSIVSIRLVARARAAGVHFTARDVFEHRTVAGLAAVAVPDGDDTGVVEELPGGGVGEMPLSPVAAKMVERGGDFDRFVMPMVLTLPEGITEEQIG